MGQAYAIDDIETVGTRFFHVVDADNTSAAAHTAEWWANADSAVGGGTNLLTLELTAAAVVQGYSTAAGTKTWGTTANRWSTVYGVDANLSGNLTVSTLTPTHVLYAGTGGLVSGDAGLTFNASTDALTVAGFLNVGTFSAASLAAGDIQGGLTGSNSLWYDQSASGRGRLYIRDATGTVAGQGSLFIDTILPQITFYENDVAADQKAWDLTATGSVFLFRTLTDALGGAVSIMEVARSGSTPTEVTWNQGAADINYRIEAVGQANCFQLDGANASIGIRTTGSTFVTLKAVRVNATGGAEYGFYGTVNASPTVDGGNTSIGMRLDVNQTTAFGSAGGLRGYQVDMATTAGFSAGTLASMNGFMVLHTFTGTGTTTIARGLYCRVPTVTGTAPTTFAAIDMDNFTTASGGTVYAIRTQGGHQVHNEAGGDWDHRWESDNNPNLAVYDGGLDAIGFGTTVSSTRLINASRSWTDTSGARYCALFTANDAGLAANSTLTLVGIAATAQHQVAFNATEMRAYDVNVNTTAAFSAGTLGSANGIAVNFTFAGAGATTTARGILITAPSVTGTAPTTFAALEINDPTTAAGGTVYAIRTFGGGIVFNENGGDWDTRIEGDNNVNLTHWDASTDTIGFGVAAASTALAYFSKSWTATSGTRQCLFFESFSDPASDATAQISGVSGVVRHRTAFNQGTLIASESLAFTTADFSAGTLLDLIGHRIQVTHAGAGLITRVTDHYIQTPSITGLGTVNTWTQLLLQDLTGGTVTTRIGIRQQGTNAHNRLQGGVSIGADAVMTAGFICDVTGDCRVSGGLAVGGTTVPADGKGYFVQGLVVGDDVDASVARSLELYDASGTLNIGLRCTDAADGVAEQTVVFNEQGQDQNWRAEGDTLAYLLYLNGDAALENIALLTTAEPNWQSMDRGLFLGEVTTSPTGNPTAGGYLFNEGGLLAWREPAGAIGTLAGAVISPAALASGTTADWAPTGLSTAQTIRVSPNGAGSTLGGLTGGRSGRRIALMNIGGVGALTLADEDGGSTAANRFALSANVVLAFEDCCLLEYDATSSRWRVLGVGY